MTAAKRNGPVFLTTYAFFVDVLYWRKTLNIMEKRSET